MTTADYALFVSLASALISVGALVWNVWQKYIFVKPDIQVSFQVMQLFEPKPGKASTLQPGKKLLSISATNMGPGPVILYACVVRGKRNVWQWKFWRRPTFGVLNPISNHPASGTPVSSGPFSGGLPIKIDAGEVKAFYFPYEKDCILSNPIGRVGISDTYGRNNWCRKRDVEKAMASYNKAFPKALA